MGNRRTWVNSLLLFAVSLTAPVPGYGADWHPEGEGWDYVRQVDDIDLYRKSVDGSRFPALLVRKKIGVSARELLDVVTDYNRFPEFVPSAAESRILEAAGRTSRVYQRLDFPRPVADRHYVISTENQVVSESAEVIRVSWWLDEVRTRALEHDGVVSPQIFSGFWRLTDAVPGVACDAVYSIHVEPGGKVPVWLYRQAAERYVVKLVQAVSERAETH